MPRTVNRQPNSVNIPDVKNQYFNHVNWKGLCTNKNYFNIDQETFEDCENVYVNSEGVLKSRPAFKDTTKHSNIVRCQKIGDYTLYVSVSNRVYVYLNDTYVALYRVKNLDFVLTYFDDKLFMIFDNEILYFDRKTSTFIDGKDYLYVPVITTYTDGVKTEYESKNVLTNAYKERYVYTDLNKISTYKHSGRVDVTINDYQYKDTYLSAQNLSKVRIKTFELPSNFTLYGDMLIVDGETIRLDFPILLTDATNKVVLTGSRYGGGTLYDDVSLELYYSVNHKTFIKIPPVENAFGLPILSHNGDVVVVFKTDGLYAYSLLESYVSGVKEFPVWTQILKFDGSMYPMLVRAEGITAGDYTDNICVGGYFYDKDNFSVMYGIPITESKYIEGINHVYVTHCELKVITCYDGEIYNHPVQPYLIDYPNNYYIVNSPIRCKSYNNKRYVYNINSFLKSNDAEVYKVVALSILGYGEYRDVWSMTEISDLNKYSYNSYAKFVTENSYYEICNSSNKILRFDVNTNTSEQIPSLNIITYVDNLTSLSDRTAYLDDVLNLLVYDGIYLFPEYTNKTMYLGLNPNDRYTNDSFYYVGNLMLLGKSVYLNELSNENKLYIDVTYQANNISTILFEHDTDLNVKYFSKNNVLYITSNRYNDNNEKLLYIPNEATETFDHNITNLHPLSKTQIGIFFENELWYAENTDLGYSYYKSKIELGCKNGADVITSADGQNVIFSTDKGLVYMSYQDFVQSTDQTLTFLSDNIFEQYIKFNKKPVRLFLYNYWIFCYHIDESVFYIFDVRNKSWWKWSYVHPIKNILNANDELELFVDDTASSRRLHVGNTDYNDAEGKINWYVTSQKLHLGTLNNYKNVISLILNNVQTELLDYPVSFNLFIKNYRTEISDRYDYEQELSYDVNLLRTYVKRCNSRKVNEFQYTLKSKDDLIEEQTYPLSLNSIIVKYNISGQVR